MASTTAGFSEPAIRTRAKPVSEPGTAARTRKVDSGKSVETCWIQIASGIVSVRGCVGHTNVFCSELYTGGDEYVRLIPAPGKIDCREHVRTNGQLAADRTTDR